MGIVITKLLNHFIRDANVRCGSFSFSVLSGKLMFREIAYITEDYTLRIHDCWLVFRYWRPFFQRDLGDDFSHGEPRIMCQIDGLEVHFYNRIDRYRDIAALYGFSVLESARLDAVKAATTDVNEKSKKKGWHWRDLIPLIRGSISSGRIAFGNSSLPTTLVITFDNVSAFYSAKPPSNAVDLYMHVLKGTGENFKASLIKSAGYRGVYLDPPRLMGEGFVVLQSSLIDFYYYQDEPGLEPEIEVGGGIERSLSRTFPCWGADFKLDQGTVISYGPW